MCTYLILSPSPLLPSPSPSVQSSRSSGGKSHSSSKSKTSLSAGPTHTTADPAPLPTRTSRRHVKRPRTYDEDLAELEAMAAKTIKKSKGGASKGGMVRGRNWIIARAGSGGEESWMEGGREGEREGEEEIIRTFLFVQSSKSGAQSKKGSGRHRVSSTTIAIRSYLSLYIHPSLPFPPPFPSSLLPSLPSLPQPDSPWRQ